MANYPASIPTFTNPIGSNKLSNPPHALQHSTLNDELAALFNEIGTYAGRYTVGTKIYNVTKYNGDDLYAKYTNCFADMPDGGIAFLPPNEYEWGNHNAAVPIPYNNIWIVGSGWGSKIMMPDDSAIYAVNLFSFTNKNNIGLFNLNFEGYYTKVDAAHLFPNYVTGIISGTVATPASQYNDGLIVSGCRFKNLYSTAGTYYTHNFWFINNYHENGHISFNGFGLQDGIVSKNIEINNGDDAFAFLVSAATTENMRTKNIIVSDNEVKYTDNTAIGSCIKTDCDTAAYPVKNIKMTGNILIGTDNNSESQAPIVLSNYSDEITIDDNSIQDNNAGSGIIVGNCPIVKISDNRIKVTAGRGIYSLNAGNVYISINGNYIEGPATGDTNFGIGIIPNGTTPLQTVITNNIINGFKAGKGIQLSGVSRAIVNNNNIRECKQGIMMYDFNYGGTPYPCNYNTAIGNNMYGQNSGDTGVLETGVGGAGCDYNVYVGNTVNNYATGYTLIGANDINQHNI